MILPGHVLHRLAELPDASVQLCCTSPPYWGLRSYGTEPQIWGGDPDCQHIWNDTPPRRARKSEDATSEKQKSNTGACHDLLPQNSCSLCGAWRGEIGLEPTPELFIQHLVEVFREVRRVLRDDGVLFLNLGDSYWGGKTGSDGLSKSTLQDGKKHQLEGNKHTGKLGIGLKPKDLCMIPARVALALQADGWWLRSDIIWNKPNPMPESVTDRPTRSHEYIFLLTKSARYFYDANAVREKAQDWGPRDRSNMRGGTQDPKLKHHGLENGDFAETGRNLRSVWTIPTFAFRGAHFATFPEELPRRCILAASSHKACEICGAAWVRVVEKSRSFESGSGKAGHIPSGKSPQGMQGGGETLDIRRGPVLHSNTLGFRPSCQCDQQGSGKCVVLDPFGGSGTTGKVAEELGRDSIIIELKPEYITMSQTRGTTTTGLTID